MNFYSTNKKSLIVGLKEVLFNGIAPDGGLYMPTEIPKLSNDFFDRADSMSFQKIALEVGKKFFLDDVENHLLEKMINDALNFEIPLVEIEKDIYALELFHGPTCAFKDVAARVMAQLFGYFAQQSKKQITILVATSGDTGSAVAHGFLNVKNIRVIILYQSGKVSEIQEKQLTGMGGNVTALEVKGTFDDCQKLVKQAFLDDEIKQNLTLASANSINIGRLLPQTFYYVYLCAQLRKKNKQVVVSVPSGNFGNLTAGLIAKRMGAQIEHFVAATNQNDTVPIYLKTGKFIPKPSIATISNAMDVGNPSNFARMLELYNHNVEQMRKDVFGISFTDEQTKNAIKTTFETTGYTMDPHGAVAYLGLKYFKKNSPDSVGVFIETAHPAKFSNSIPIPERLKDYLDREKKSVLLGNSFSDLKKFLLD